VAEVAEVAEVPPEALTVSNEEREFMHALADFVPTPRAAKRFANTYRLVRVLSQDDDRISIDPQANDNYKAALVLLAVLVGFPNQAGWFFQTLIDTKTSTWSGFSKSLAPSMLSRGSASPDAHGVLPPPASESTSVQANELELLSTRLQRLGRSVSLPRKLEPYQDWAPLLSRYSFVTERIVAKTVARRA